MLVDWSRACVSIFVARGGLGDQLVVPLLAGGEQLVVTALGAGHELVVLALGLTDHLVVVRLALADQPFTRALALGHVLVVQLLGERDDTGRAADGSGPASSAGAAAAGFGAPAASGFGAPAASDSASVAASRARAIRSAASFSACSASALAAAIRSAASRSAGALGAGVAPAPSPVGIRPSRSAPTSRWCPSWPRPCPCGSPPAAAQVVALRGQPPHLGHDVVEEVVDVTLVIALPELGRPEVLVEDLLGRQSHGVHLGRLVRTVPRQW